MRILRIILLLIVVLALTAGPVAAGESSHKPLIWRQLQPGVSFTRAEATRYCRMGEPFIGVVRLDPERVRFKVFHMSDEEKPRPLVIEEWRRKTGAWIMFNPGQYDERGAHLGLLIRDGANIGTGLLSVWKGIFVAEPVNPALPKAILIDLAYTKFNPSTTQYTQAVQSFMLLDHQGRKRVRRSDWKANRTVLAMDQAGRIVVLCTEGAYTLWELASWLQESDLGIVKAMSLDGGHAAELVIHINDFSYSTYGQWVTNDFGNLSLPGFKATLPAVVGVFPR